MQAMSVAIQLQMIPIRVLQSSISWQDSEDVAMSCSMHERSLPQLEIYWRSPTGNIGLFMRATRRKEGSESGDEVRILHVDPQAALDPIREPGLGSVKLTVIAS